MDTPAIAASPEVAVDAASVTSPTESKPAAPAYHALTYYSMVLIGFGLLLPFNFVLNSIPYFSLYFGPTIAYDISVAFTTPQLLMQPLMLSMGHLTPPHYRMMGTFLAQAIAMAAMPFLGVVSIGVNTLLMACAGMATAIMESSVLGFCSMLPPEYTQGVMVGEAVAGLLSSGAQLLVKAMLQHDPATVARVYFATACVTMLTCAGTIYRIQKSEVVTHYMKLRRTGTLSESPPAQSDTAHILAAHESVDTTGLGEDGTATPPTVNPAAMTVPSEDVPRRPASAQSRGRNLVHAAKMWFVAVRQVVRHMWMAGLATFLNFVATFLTYPGITASVRFWGSPVANTVIEEDPGWWTVLLFFVFGAFDLVGRFLAARTPVQGHARILMYAISRFIWVPLLVGCARGWTGFQNDVAPMLLTALSAMTNGHCVSLSMMEAPATVPGGLRELAGFVQVLFLHSGISAGSVFALGLE